MELIKTNQLSFSYKDTPILDNLNISFKAGEITAIVGENGSGKSTLLKLLIRELESTKGSVFLLSKELKNYSRKESAKSISYVSQNSNTPNLLVHEYISLSFYPFDKQLDINKVLSIFNIEDLKDKDFISLSGGEKQLVALARAFLQGEKVILLDEPCNNLDIKNQDILMNAMLKLKQENKSVVAVLHDLNQALSIADNTIMLQDGKILSYGKTCDVITKENIERLYGVNVEIIRDNNFSTIIYPYQIKH